MILSTKAEQSRQRNYGIDLLRLLAAFYVIVLHTINQGGVYEATAPYSYQNLICRLLLAFSLCAVNIFGIISGYVGYREPKKEISYSGYLSLWLTVVFYSVILTGIYMHLLPGTVTWEDLANSFFPVTKKLYWYFSAYTLVYFLSPFLNRALYYSSDKELKRLFFLICIVCVTIEYIGDCFAMYHGYSAIWLLLLYIIGAIMKKTGIGNRIPSFIILLAIIAINIILFYLDINTPITPIFIFRICFEIRYSYITPFYLATAILYVILFSRLKLHLFWQKIIAFAAPAAFSVYIANTQPSFWVHFLKDRFAHWATGSPLGILARTITFSFGFVLTVVIVDYFRQKLFRFLQVQNWLKKIPHTFQKNTAD